MTFANKKDGIVFLHVSPDELASIIRSNVRAEFDARFTAETQADESTRDHSDDLLTVEETTRLLNVSRVTLKDWERKGILSPV